jgi:hypothetical protein
MVDYWHASIIGWDLGGQSVRDRKDYCKSCDEVWKHYYACGKGISER